MRTAKDWITEINDWAKDNNVPITEKTALWGFLTALRGPDDDGRLKYCATTHLRMPIGNLAVAAGATVARYDMMQSHYVAAQDPNIPRRQAQTMFNTLMDQRDAYGNPPHFAAHSLWSLRVLTNMGYIDGIPSADVHSSVGLRDVLFGDPEEQATPDTNL